MPETATAGERLAPSYEYRHTVDVADAISPGSLSGKQQEAVAFLVERYTNTFLQKPDEERDVFRTLDEAEHQLARISGDSDGSILTEAYMSCRRLFSGNLMQAVMDVTRDEGNARGRELSRNIYESFVACHPSINSYTGGIPERLQLAAYSLRTPELQQLFYRNIRDDLIYDMSFNMPADAVREGLATGDVLQKLHVIHVLKDIGMNAEYLGEWAGSAQRTAETVLREGALDVSAPPLVRLVMAGASEEIRSASAAEWVDYDPFDTEHQRLFADHEKRVEEYESEQARLAKAYPQLAGEAESIYNSSLRAIAKDAAGIFLGGQLQAVARQEDGHEEVTALYQAGHSDFLNDDHAQLLAELHRPDAQHVVEGELGIKLEQLGLSEQIQLLDFMAKSDANRYERLCRVMQGFDTRGRLDYAAMFFAAEFGEDFGDSLLAIAETQPKDEVEDISGLLADFRKQSHQFAAWFDAYDPELARATERAMNERLTDTLTALEALAVEGRLEIDLGPGGHFELDSIDGALEIMTLQQRAMQTIHEVITDPEVETSQVTEDNNQFAMYRFISETHGQVLLYVRPEGAKGYDRRFEYGNRQGVEASISFIANPVDPHALLTEKDPEGVSIRFDREGRKKDESPFSEDRDPTRGDGSISLDISSIMGRDDSPAVRIGKLVAAGNVLRAAKNGGFESLHHNNNHFDQERYGDAEGFSKLAVYIMHLAEAQISMQRHGRHRSRFGRLAIAGGRADVKSAA